MRGLLRVSDDYTRNTASVVTYAGDVGEGLKELRSTADDFLLLLESARIKKASLAQDINTMRIALDCKLLACFTSS